ncbi:MAG: histidine--tRNA ligase [Lachnospiraceae bacterium]|nr:histidine--tRNA ligase [Lachnospiraceae bacterium]
MKITSVKGTNDYLPKETKLRDYLQGKILETYRSCGFERITTPILEDIENLDKSEGGENLNLLFKVLKRGDKLEKALETGNPKELSDLGLRYDLTLPLSRYYACHRADLPAPFKCIQIDQVFRAERPQKGRLRQFVQCDIDILGSDSVNCEIELISTTAKALLNVGIKNFKVKINDRRVLKSLIYAAGFTPEDADSVCIVFDKMDKIGAEGVAAELIEKGFSTETVKRFTDLMSISPFTLDEAEKYCEDKAPVESLRYIIDTVTKLAGDSFSIVYDKSLVRGQGYYTGTIFEIESLDFGSSIAGGGRYDNLIGKFLNESVPAVGFSIGFERIVSILTAANYQIPNDKKRVAVIYDATDILPALTKADELRSEYEVVLYERPKKLGKLFGKLEEQGFYGCFILNESGDVKVFGA